MSIPSQRQGTNHVTLSVIIPVYNEVRTICELIRRVADVPIPKQIVVVDDGSTDGTREALHDMQNGSRLTLGDHPTGPSELKVVFHDRNHGKGAALRTGFQAATGDILLIQDADLEYDPHDYHRLMEPLVRGEADAVIGSRFVLRQLKFFVRDGSPFLSHYLGNKFIIWLTNLLYGFQATDYEGCYKAFTREVIHNTPVIAKGFEFDNELVCKLLRRRRRIAEVPINYAPRVYREGKKIRWHDGVRIIWTILKWRVMPF